MKLREVFTKPKGKIKWTTKTAKKWVGNYSVDDRGFEFNAMKGDVDDSELHPYEDKVDKKETWFVVFFQLEPGYIGPAAARRRYTDITGKGKSIEVLNKTLVAAKEFVKGAKPAYIYFSAKEPSKYEKMVVDKLDHHDTRFGLIESKLTQIQVDIATLKVKAGVWGGIAGLVPVVLGLVLFYVTQSGGK